LWNNATVTKMLGTLKEEAVKRRRVVERRERTGIHRGTDCTLYVLCPINSLIVTLSVLPNSKTKSSIKHNILLCPYAFAAATESLVDVGACRRCWGIHRERMKEKQGCKDMSVDTSAL